MSMLANQNAMGGADYTISNSLRFRGSASASISRTPSVASNRKTWTFSAWVKRGSLSSNQTMFSGYTSGTTYLDVRFNAADALEIINYTASSVNFQLVSSKLFRDTSSWYHIVVSMDTTNATASSRISVYINGVAITSFSTATYPTLNFDTQVNLNTTHALGSEGGAYYYSDGYLAEVNFIDGQALSASSFGYTDASTGVWKPKKYSGAYGTNGFYLPFNNTSTTTTLCADSSGNGNNWTPTAISLTAGITYDAMIDSPSLAASGTRPVGNYAVLNPLDSYVATIDDANLSYTSGASTGAIANSSIVMSSGKWYAEFTQSATAQAMIGVCNMAVAVSSRSWTTVNAWGYYAGTGLKYTAGAGLAYGAAYGIGDIIGVALDCDAGTLTFYKNGVSQGVAYSTGLTGKLLAFMCGSGSGAAGTVIKANFGQRPFSYTPPTGYKALCTSNLPDSTILKGSDHFNIALATGANIKTTTEAIFTNKLEWIKDRANANNHQLLDTVRGLTAVLQSNTTAAETTYVAPTGNSVGWTWNLAGSPVTNNAGTISSQVAANTVAGISAVTYTGNGTAGATVGHGLGIAPSMIVTFSRSVAANSHNTYHKALTANGGLYLDLINAYAASALFWNNIAPTSTVFTLGSSANANGNGTTNIAYCFAEIAGFSKFDSYTGNGSADGPFVYCGFRPKFIMIKNASTASTNWLIYDAATNTYNAANLYNLPNSTLAEQTTGADIDLLSNGFKIRNTSGSCNGSGATLIYAAFAENPFKNSVAR